jgi:hypothetical protein
MISRENSAQIVQEVLGFVVLAYNIQEEYDKELASMLVNGATVNSASIADDVQLRVIGTATRADWERQCDLCGETYEDAFARPYIGYLKVVAG